MNKKWRHRVKESENGIDSYKEKNSRLQSFLEKNYHNTFLLCVVIEVLVCKTNYTKAPMKIKQFITHSSWNTGVINDTAAGISFVTFISIL